MVLQERIELSTSPLPRECSTTELLQLTHDPENHGLSEKDHAANQRVRA